ncbi:MAG: histidine phosphatase family protein [Synergistaceae bacterium]|jgi:alpha-ribazole phosphatase/probable phosphoglycerate mutase|nr:histidine phosphatase family protein [Synergistaceae bacterium]
MSEDAYAPHRIFLIRHGETDWNRDFRYQGISDIELNETGREQARLAGIRLAGTVPANVYSSPLSRARRTAEIIMEHNRGDIGVELCGDLREVSFGKWEGLPASEVEKRYPDTLSAWRAAPFSATPEGGEPFAEVRERSKKAARLVISAGRPGSVTFVVAHGGVMRAFLASLMNIEDFSLMWRMRFDNCSISVLDIWGTRPSMLLLNDTNHIRLEEDEISRMSFSR